MATDFYSDFHGPVVETDKGKVRGYFEKGVYKFRGIKYANAKRYCSPEEVEPWDGVKDCLAYGKVAPTIEGRGTAYETMGILVEYRWMPEDEDCQYINVWTQSIDGSQKKPVMVWLHGGGFFCGSSIEFNAYEAENLCKDGGVVVVSLNHRLNIIGYFDLSDFGDEYANSGNAGGDDIIAALKWVRDNVERFGGDPDNVTVFGESAGGISVLQHLCSPLSRGLFHRAIVMSGTGYFGKMLDARREQQTLKAAEKTGERVFEKLGIADLEQLRRVPAEAFISVQREMPEAFLPVIDGCFCTDWLDRLLLENRYANVPILMGCTSQEAGLFRAQGDKSGRDWNRFFQIPAFAWAELAAECQERKPVYFYWFSRSIPNLGPWHAMELHYLFHVLHRTSRRLYQADLDLEDAMAAYWCNFAAAGDPNGEGLVRWEPYTQESGGVLELGDLIRMRRRSDFLELSAEVDFALGK